MEKAESRPSISIIIPTWNNESTLERLLISISNQKIMVYEVLVIDRNSTDKTPEIASRWGASYFGEQAGRSEARNFGASKAKGEFLLFLDSDMELATDVLEKCIANVKDYDSLCLREVTVAGKSYWVNARALERDQMFHSFYYESPRFFRKEVFETVGGYDVTMVGFEDLDLHANLIEKGFKVGWAEAIVYHHEEDVGLIRYLSKRSLYATTAKIYANRHPAYWKELRSPTRRMQLILQSVKSSGSTSNLYLLPGLFITRLLEYMLSI